MRRPSSKGVAFTLSSDLVVLSKYEHYTPVPQESTLETDKSSENIGTTYLIKNLRYFTD